MTPEQLPADVMDFLNWFVGEQDPSNPNARIMEYREGITYDQVAQQLRDKYRQ